VNTKGGVGKTSLCVNVAAALADTRKVVVIDSDSQGTATAWAAQGKLPLQVVTAPLENQSEVEGWAQRVRQYQSEADLVAIDSPPHVGISATAVFLLSDLVCIPVTASGADLIATRRALALLREAQETRHDGGKPDCLLVPSKVDRRLSAGREIETALGVLDQPISAAVCQRSAFIDSFTRGQWVGQFNPRSKATQEITALAAEIARRIEWRRSETA